MRGHLVWQLRSLVTHPGKAGRRPARASDNEEGAATGHRKTWGKGQFWFLFGFGGVVTET